MEENERKSEKVASSQVGSILRVTDDRLSTLEQNFAKLFTDVATAKKSVSKTCMQVDAFATEIKKIKRDDSELRSDELVPCNNSSNLMEHEKVLEVERTLYILSVRHSELELQLQASLASTYNGTFLWRIPEMKRRIHDAKVGQIACIFSPPFYIGTNGYKMCIRAYLNGDGTGEGKHLSIFFVLMRGEYDPLLQWPFKHKVSLILVDQDQRNNIVQKFLPNTQSRSFRRPQSDMNVASGFPEFAELSIFDNPSYVKDDVMYIKAEVDITNIQP